MAKQRNGTVVLAVKVLAGVLGTGVLGLGAWQAEAFLGHEKIEAHPVAATKIEMLIRQEAECTATLKALDGKVEVGFEKVDHRLDVLGLQQATMNGTQQAILDEVKRLRPGPP